MQHVFKATLIVINLLLHLALIFLEIRETLLKMRVLLLLVRNCLVVRITNELQTRHDVRHVILVYSFQHVPHLFNLSTIEFRLFLILLQLLKAVVQLLLKS